MMNPIVKSFMEMQSHGISIRPQKAGFPFLAEALRRGGALKNLWSLPSCQSIYILKELSIVQQLPPLFTGTREVPRFDSKALISAIRRDQDGESTFPEFLGSAWEAGVVSYEVDFLARRVAYFGTNKESYCEDYPHVEIPL